MRADRALRGRATRLGVNPRLTSERRRWCCGSSIEIIIGSGIAVRPRRARSSRTSSGPSRCASTSSYRVIAHTSLFGRSRRARAPASTPSRRAARSAYQCPSSRSMSSRTGWFGMPGSIARPGWRLRRGCVGWRPEQAAQGGSHHEPGRLRVLRLRQPLLRGDRRLHPPHRAGHGEARTMQWAEIDGRQRLLVGGKVNRFIPNPTFDPISKPGALDEYFRGRNPKGAGHQRAVRRPRPDQRAPRVPRPRRPPEADGRAGHGGRHLPAHARRRHGAGAARRPARAASPRSARSTAGSTRTGASPTRSGSSPRRCSRWSTPTRRSPSCEWALDRDARFFVLVPGPGDHARRARVARRPGVRPVLGAAQRGRRGRHRARRRRLLLAAPRRLGRGRRDGGVPAEPVPRHRVVRAPCRTRSPTCSRTACSSASRTCAWRRSRPAPTGCSTSSRS